MSTIKQKIAPPVSVVTDVIKSVKTNVFIPEPIIENKPKKICNISACNNLVRKSIIRNWGINDSSKKFKSCVYCPSLWYRRPNDVSKDGKTWNKYDDKNSAYMYASNIIAGMESK